ncbi:MAG: sugar ABC transporter substrate-binding protein [Nitriliruptoraceae bacterium]
MLATQRRRGYRRLTPLLVVLLMLGLLAACGGEADSEEPTTSGDETEEDTDDAPEEDDGGGAEEEAEDAEGADDTEGADGELAGPDDVQLNEDQVEEIRSLDLTFAINTNNNTDDFSQTIVRGAQSMADELGIELIVQSADFDAQQQLSQIDSLVQQQVDAIFLIAVDADAVSTGVLAANEAGIPVLIVGGPPTRGDVITVLNAASYEGTYESASLLAAELGEGGTAGILGIPLALSVIEDRNQGTRDGLEDNGIEVVAEQQSFNQEELVGQAESMIQANPDLSGLYATWSLAINAALAAVEQSGQDIKIAGHDAERAGFEAFEAENPNLVALTAQQPFLQGEVGITALASSLLGGTIAPDLQVPNLLVTPENYRDQWDVLYPGIDAPWE